MRTFNSDFYRYLLTPSQHQGTNIMKLNAALFEHIILLRDEGIQRVQSQT